MNKSADTDSIAIIGLGPRGLHALESIVDVAAQKKCELPDLLLYESAQYIGAGPIYDIDQQKTNWLNIPMRNISIPERREVQIGDIIIPSFPSFLDSQDRDALTTKDVYPSRANIGQYLHRRATSILSPLRKAQKARLIKEKVISIRATDDEYIITTDKGSNTKTRKVLLTIGHQTNKTKEELKKWNKQVDGDHLILNPYPISGYLSATQGHESIALRGAGLTMIDIVRAIAEDRGKFVKLDDQWRYQSSSRYRLIPYSTDHLAIAPKPYNHEIDKKYRPDKSYRAAFSQGVKDQNQQQKATSKDWIIQLMIPSIIAVYQKFSHNTESISQLSKTISEWMHDEQYQSKYILNQKASIADQLSRYRSMAIGIESPSLDYCIGQVWRHLQHSIFDGLSHGSCPPKVMKEIIGLHERLKRYTYGPPVDSILMLLALHSSRHLDLDYYNDPEISLSDDQWQLSCGDKTIKSTMLINTVLDGYDADLIDTDLWISLKAQGLIESYDDGLGVRTDESAHLINTQENSQVSLIGRLATGSIIGADSLKECFKAESKEWVKSVLS